MPSLICEGACNPTVQSLDALVRDAGRIEWRKVGKTIKSVTDLSPVVSAQLRGLLYTPHTLRSATDKCGERFVCAACGHARRFGGER